LQRPNIFASLNVMRAKEGSVQEQIGGAGSEGEPRTRGTRQYARQNVCWKRSIPRAEDRAATGKWQTSSPYCNKAGQRFQILPKFHFTSISP